MPADRGPIKRKKYRPLSELLPRDNVFGRARRVPGPNALPRDAAGQTPPRNFQPNLSEGTRAGAPVKIPTNRRRLPRGRLTR